MASDEIDPLPIAMLRANEVGDWYWGTTAGGFEATWGEYKSRSVNKLPTYYLEWFVKTKKPHVQSPCRYERAVAEYYTGLQSFMQQGQNSGKFIVPMGEKYKNIELNGIRNDSDWCEYILQRTGTKIKYPLFVSAVGIWCGILQSQKQSPLFVQPRSNIAEQEDEKDGLVSPRHWQTQQTLVNYEDDSTTGRETHAEWSDDDSVQTPPVTPSPSPSKRRRRQESDYDTPEPSSPTKRLKKSSPEPEELVNLHLDITLDRKDLLLVTNLMQKSKGMCQIEVEKSSSEDDVSQGWSVVRNSKRESSSFWLPVSPIRVSEILTAGALSKGKQRARTPPRRSSQR